MPGAFRYGWGFAIPRNNYKMQSRDSNGEGARKNARDIKRV